MKNILFILILMTSFITFGYAQRPDANAILAAIDKNMTSTSSRLSSRMVIHSRRASRTVASINYSQGNNRFYAEYTDPPREKGTKMLKLDDNLWIYEPSSDRTIQISGNMLKQSVMGSDLSYEDFMEETSLARAYNARITGEKVHDGRNCWIMELNAKSDNVSYPKRILYVDKERNIALYEELYAKSGRLLKTTTSSDITRFGNRWYPKKIVFKDELKDGKGTEFIIDEIEFNIAIPERYFNRAALRK
ncbi:MAG: outer membrane lipoprotein-sorting protein [Candidatus Cloacimonadaceae bacterium]|nr:outer membrane lipoprotein-sorting protein [Candidatus Cloacimonadaceae bacterium]